MKAFVKVPILYLKDNRCSYKCMFLESDGICKKDNQPIGVRLQSTKNNGYYYRSGQCIASEKKESEHE